MRWGKSLVACAAACCIALPSRAAEPPCEPHSLAFYELGALYYRGPEGQYTGIDKDVVEEVARRSGCRFTTMLESRVRIWDRLSRQLLDLSVSGIANPEREKFAEFIPYFQTRNHVLMRSTTAKDLPTPDAFLADSQRSIAVVKSFKHGAFYDAWLDRLRADGRVIEVADFPAALRSLQLGRVDALLALPTSWAPFLQKPGIKGQYLTLDWSPQDRVVHGLIVSKDRVSEADKQRLRSAIQSMLRDGSMEAIFARHVGEAVAKQMRIDSTEGK